MQRHRLTFSSQVGVFALCDYYLFLGGTLTIHSYGQFDTLQWLPPRTKKYRNEE